ncbi:uncharacterized protein LOC117115545 [Anneissia japonica]|uniref:uncharacterized protein LOC117115545 n=1 Tax=Anneissia japonica TaxID=1529436 RepID=UPI001425A724|nr:uncharacterized protein LOC117115545 [Anneissia japonica]
MSPLLAGYSKHKGKKHLCSRCMHVFGTEELKLKHEPDCRGINDGLTAMQLVDEKGNLLIFKNLQHRAMTPFVIYADFECILEKMPADESGPKTVRDAKHVPCGWSYVVVRHDGQVVGHGLHRANADNADTCVKSLLEHLVIEKDKIVDIYKRKPVDPRSVMTSEDEARFEAATTCWICERGDFTEYTAAADFWKCNKVKNNPDNKYKMCYECSVNKKGQKVRDHCHVTDTYRGAAHAGCNLKLRLHENTPIPVLFHNLTGYDGHLIMQGIGKMPGKTECIPSNTEKYISFTLENLRFIDSMKFLNASLSTLVSKMPIDKFKLTKAFFGGEGDLELLMRKGVYPYEYMDSFDKFREEGLPSKELFYSSLRDEGISDADYEHSARAYEHFKCKNLGDYHDHYLKTDALLLADVFQNFRSSAYREYGLGPCNYYTLPGFSWDALLRKTGVALELLTDLDMHLMIEKGIRGGLTMVSHRYCKFNNKYMDDYDETKPSTYGIDLDENNLYGCSMRQSLPVSDFRWIDPGEYKKVLEAKVDADKGYFLEVDLEVPKELHDLFNDYPLAPEMLAPRREWMSPYQLNLLGDDEPKDEKLVPTLMSKTKYVLHYRNLQFYLAKGLVLTKVHRIIEFTQRAWMKEYIDMNTELRKAAKTDFEKDFFKLMNNSVFGKTMENVRNRQTVILCKNSETRKKDRLMAKPNFNRYVVINDDLVAIHMNKTRVVLNKPIYCGAAVLDLSKLVMYEFYYDKLKPMYGDRVKLLYTDTDSMFLKITTEDVYADMRENLDWFDTSNYDKDSMLYSEKNKKVPGKMKDELGGTIMTEFVALKPKMYSFKTQDPRLDVKRAKGVAKYVVKGHLRHDDYVRVLTSREDMYCDMTSIRSSKHLLYTFKQTKKSLCPLDTKMYILDDRITSYAHGNYRIAQAGNESRSRDCRKEFL